MNVLAELPLVPLIDVGRDGAPALYRAGAEAAHDQLDRAVARYGRLPLRLADRWSRRWLERRDNPLVPEIAEVARQAGRPGAWLLNLSYEWGCSTGVTPDGAGGMRLLRTLDWPFDGLGRALLAAHQEGPAGPWLNLTWPGFAGVLTALCPGRFAVAFNQPPMTARHLGPVALPLLADWALDRLAWSRARGLPPAHLLRLVCDEAADYAEARRQIEGTPLCASCFVSLAGARAGEGCVIERTPAGARVHEAPVAVTNHWLSRHPAGHARNGDSEERLTMMRGLMAGAGDLDWVRPPILNGYTRLAAELSPASGAALVQGFEEDGPATRPTRLAA